MNAEKTINGAAVIEYKSPSAKADWNEAKRLAKEQRRLNSELEKSIEQVVKALIAVEEQGKKLFAAAPKTDGMFADCVYYKARLRDAVTKEMVFQGFKEANPKFHGDPVTYRTLTKQLEEAINWILKFAKTEVDKLV